MKKKPLLIAIVAALALASLVATVLTQQKKDSASSSLAEESESHSSSPLTPAVPAPLDPTPELPPSESEAVSESSTPPAVLTEEEMVAMKDEAQPAENETALEPDPAAEEALAKEAEAKKEAEAPAEEMVEAEPETLAETEPEAEAEAQPEAETVEPEVFDPWESVEIDGDSYVTLRSVKDFYRFDDLRVEGSAVILEKPNVRIKLIMGQPDVWMNNIKFIFSYPLTRKDKRFLINRIDLVKLLDPVMRPHFIENGQRVETVIIDPGHGGKDPGTTSPHGNGAEKKHALSLSQKLAKQLKQRGFKVTLTRDDDTYLSLQQRVDFANEYQNAVYVSLHFNSGGGGQAQGIETYTLSPQGVAGKEEALKEEDFEVKPGNNNDAANIALATAIHASVIKNTGRRDRGIRRARYSVLSGVNHPAILLEGGFLSNRTEGAYIARNDYQERVAFSIAEAIVKYKVATEGRKPQ